MKLVEILARELKEWPEGAGDAITQSVVDTMIYSDDANERGHIGICLSRRHTEDCDYPRVTRAEWEAERARMAMDCISAFSQEQDQAEQAVSQYEQELWDRVAASSLSGVIAAYTDDDVKNNIAHCFEYADAFMAERAKRLNR